MCLLCINQIYLILMVALLFFWYCFWLNQNLSEFIRIPYRPSLSANVILDMNHVSLWVYCTMICYQSSFLTKPVHCKVLSIDQNTAELHLNSMIRLNDWWCIYKACIRFAIRNISLVSFSVSTCWIYIYSSLFKEWAVERKYHKLSGYFLIHDLMILLQEH